MKRFSGTDKWDDPWYRKLKPRFKAFLQYLWDRCDSAGVWVVDLELAATYVGEGFTHVEALKAFDGRVVDIGDGRWLIPGFVAFQYGALSPSCHPHKRVLECLKKHKLSIGEDGNTTLPTTLPNRVPERVDTLEDKEEDKEEERKGRECEGNLFPPEPTIGDLVFPHNLRTEAFRNSWQQWISFRKKLKSCKDWIGMFQKQLEWLGTFPESNAIAILEQSMRNGWQGLQEVKNYGNGHQGYRNGTPRTAVTASDHKKGF